MQGLCLFMYRPRTREIFSRGRCATKSWGRGPRSHILWEAVPLSYKYIYKILQFIGAVIVKKSILCYTICYISNMGKLRSVQFFAAGFL